MTYNRLIPEITVTSIKESLSFYCDVLGFEKTYEGEDKDFSFISFYGSQLLLQENSNEAWKKYELEYPFGRGVNFSIETDDIDKLVSNLEKANISLLCPLEERWYKKDDMEHGEKHFIVMDPDGYILRFMQKKRKKTI